MFATSTFCPASTRTPRTAARSAHRPAFRPRLEVLEGRSVPSFGWAAAVGGDSGNAVATDAAGNVYMTGSYSGSFMPAGSSVTLNSAGGTDIFVAKYARSGAFQWAVSLGGTQDDAGKGIAVDGAGTHLYVVGQSNGAYVADLDGATGAVRWARNIAGDVANVVAVDGSINAYAVSNNTAGGQFAGGAYVTKLDSSGSQQWQDTITATGTGAKPRAAGVAVSGSNVFVSGIFTNNANFAVGSQTYTVTSKYAWQGFVLKLSGGNTYGWAKTFQGAGSGGYVFSNRIAADSSGNVYAYGQFEGVVDFTGAGNKKGAWTLDGGLYISSNGSAFVTKLNAAGQVIWAEKFATPSSSGMISNLDYQQNATIAVDAAGAVYMTGTFSGTLSFNPAGGANLTSAGGNDIFVVKLDTNGAFQWAVSAGGTGDDWGNGIAVDGFGDIYVTGYIGAGTATFGDPTHTLTTATQTAFLWQITQP
jgi:hypothetical protein